jgi:hypothetical protein
MNKSATCQNEMLQVYSTHTIAYDFNSLRTPLKNNSNTLASSVRDSVVTTVTIIFLWLY